MSVSSSALGSAGYGQEMAVAEPVSFEEVAVYFSVEEWALLDPGQSALYWDVMQENYEAVSWLGFPVSKVHVLSWVERGEELRIPDLQGCEEGEVCDTHTAGDGMLSENHEKNLQQEGQEQMAPCEMLLGRSEGHVSQSTEEEEACENQRSPQRHQGNHPGEGQGKSSHRSRGRKTNTETVKQKIPPQESPCTCSDCAALLTHDRALRGEKPFSCSDCGKSFICSSKLDTHSRSHKGEKPFSCSDYGKSFSRNANLLIHTRTHMGEKPFYCSDCGKSFSSSTVFNSHWKSHKGERPFSCSDCVKSFSRSSNLLNHMGAHTGEKPFSRSDCGKSFSCSSKLDTHCRSHKGEKPFSCSDCGESFIWRTQLVRHWRMHTGEKPNTRGGENLLASRIGPT